MEFKLNITRINDEKVIPAFLITLLFMLAIFILMPAIKLPMVLEKPSEEMIIAFLKEEMAPQKKKLEEKKVEKKEEQKEIQVEVTEKLDQVVPEDIEDIQPNVEDFKPASDQIPIMADLNQMETQNVSESFTLPGTDGVTDILTDINNPGALLDAGAGMGGESAGFDGDIGDVKVGNPDQLLKRGLYQNRRQNISDKPSKGVRPHLNLKSSDVLNPIIEWMKKNPAKFSEILKTFLDWTPSNLTSKAPLFYEGKKYIIFLLCKPELPQLSILIADMTDPDAEEFILIKDAGMIRMPGYLLEGKYMQNVAGDDFSYFEGRQKEATNNAAKRFNDIFYSWFEKVNPTKK